MEPRKAAGLAAVLSHGSTMNTQKTTLLSSIFKRGDKGDLGVAPRQALAGAESTMNGPAKTIQVSMFNIHEPSSQPNGLCFRINCRFLRTHIQKS